MKIALGPLHFSSVAKQSLRWTWAGAAAASALRRSPTCPAVRSSPPSRAAATPSARGASAGGARRPPRAALTARDYGGAATQGGKHSPESAERQSAAVAKADKVPSTPPPGLEPTVVSGRRVKSPAAAQRVRSDFVEISSRFRRDFVGVTSSRRVGGGPASAGAMGRPAAWGCSETSRRLHEPSTRQRGGCSRRARPMECDQARTGSGLNWKRINKTGSGLTSRPPRRRHMLRSKGCRLPREGIGGDKGGGAALYIDLRRGELEQ